MKRLSEGQKRTLSIATYFSPLDMSLAQGGLTDDTYLGTMNVMEDINGMSPERAFLASTERGAKDLKVTNKKKYMLLLKGHNRAAMQVKAWSEGFREGTLFKSDFDEEPEYIKELAMMAYEAGKSNRYDHVTRLGFTEYTLELLNYIKKDEDKKQKTS